jgi:hypothetical protein
MDGWMDGWILLSRVRVETRCNPSPHCSLFIELERSESPERVNASPFERLFQWHELRPERDPVCGAPSSGTTASRIFASEL